MVRRVYPPHEEMLAAVCGFVAVRQVKEGIAPLAHPPSRGEGSCCGEGGERKNFVEFELVYLAELEIRKRLSQFPDLLIDAYEYVAFNAH